MKRLTACILLAVLLFTTFSACSGGPSVTLMSFIDASDTSLDFGGVVVTVCSESEVEEMIFEQTANTTMYDAILTRFDELEKKYNCTFEHVFYGRGQKMVEALTPKISTADGTIDIIYGHGDNAIGNLASGGYLYPLSELKDYLNYENSDKFGSAGILESAMIGGIPYAVQPVQWVGFPNSFAYVIVWNYEKFAQLGLPNLHEYYETETWTWDNFEALFATYSTMAEPEKYLISVYKPFFALSAMMSNGVKFCDYNGTDFYCDIADQKTYTAGEWAQSLFSNYSDIISAEDNDYGVETFAAEQVFMVPAQTGVTALSLPYKVDFQFGLMPFPSGPDGTYGEWANFVHAIRGFGISSGSDIPDISAIIINDLFEPFSELSTENGLRDYYNEQVFFTEIDTEIYLDVGKYARSIYAADDMVIWDFAHAFKGDTQTAAQIIESYKNRMENFVAKTLRPNFENYVYDHLYGDK